MWSARIPRTSNAACTWTRSPGRSGATLAGTPATARTILSGSSTPHSGAACAAAQAAPEAFRLVRVAAGGEDRAAASADWPRAHDWAPAAGSAARSRSSCRPWRSHETWSASWLQRAFPSAGGRNGQSTPGAGSVSRIVPTVSACPRVGQLAALPDRRDPQVTGLVTRPGRCRRLRGTLGVAAAPRAQDGSGRARRDGREAAQHGHSSSRRHGVADVPPGGPTAAARPR